jgi:hypothetical protein
MASSSTVAAGAVYRPDDDSCRKLPSVITILGRPPRPGLRALLKKDETVRSCEHGWG